jgi:prepilin-type N-terminal cleavage/methylation domain-containing protein
MNSYRTARQRAFTLVEIIIAIAIFAAVMIAIYSSWSAILRGKRIGQDAAAEAQRSRVAVRVLENSLMSLQMFMANIKYDYFSADTSGDFATLSFVAHLAKSFPRNGDFGDQVVRRLTFTVEPEPKSGNVLLLRQNPVLFQTSADEEENPLVLARNVKEFTLEFWGPRSKDWEPEWLYTNQLPKLIRFTLGFGRANQRVLQPEDVVTRVVSLAAIPVPVGVQTAGGLQTRPANPTIQPPPANLQPPPANPRQPPGSTRSR